MVAGSHFVEETRPENRLCLSPFLLFIYLPVIHAGENRDSLALTAFYRGMKEAYTHFNEHGTSQNFDIVPPSTHRQILTNGHTTRIWYRPMVTVQARQNACISMQENMQFGREALKIA